MGIYCECTLLTNLQYFNIKSPCCRLQCFFWIESSVHLETFNLGEGDGYIRGEWQVQLGLHTIFLHNCVYCRLHSRVAQCKSYYTFAHTIYHNQCTGYWNRHFRLHFPTGNVTTSHAHIVPDNSLLTDGLFNLEYHKLQFTLQMLTASQKASPQTQTRFNATKLCWSLENTLERAMKVEALRNKRKFKNINNRILYW